MFDVLNSAINDLPLLIKNGKWNSLHVVYEPPRVERLWIQYDNDHRIFLHRIHPCGQHKPFFHPHPWPSAVHIISGTYEMDIGYGEGLIAPPIASTVRLSKGSCYEMIDINQWHSVRPLNEPSLSIMVTGKPWKREMPINPPPQPCLDDDVIDDLKEIFYYHLT